MNRSIRRVLLVLLGILIAGAGVFLTNQSNVLTFSVIESRHSPLVFDSGETKQIPYSSLNAISEQSTLHSSLNLNYAVQLIPSPTSGSQQNAEQNVLCVSQSDESCLFSISIDGSQTLQAKFGEDHIDLGKVDADNEVGLRVYIQGRKIAFVRDGIIWNTNGAGSEIVINQPNLITGLELSAPSGFNTTVLALSSSVTSVTQTQQGTISNLMSLFLVILGSALIVGVIFWRIRGNLHAASSLQKTLRISAIVIAAIWIVNLVQGFLGAGPRIWFSNDFYFSDFYQMQILSLGDPYHFEGSIYPPMGNLFLRPTLLWPEVVAPTVILGASLGVIGACFVILLSKLMGWQGILYSILLTFSYPVLFAFDRGNLDLPVLALSCLAALTLFAYPWLASTLLGIAGALKLFPLALFFPLIRVFKTRLVLFGGFALAGILTLVAGLYLGLSPLNSLMSLFKAGSFHDVERLRTTWWGTSISQAVSAGKALFQNQPNWELPYQVSLGGMDLSLITLCLLILGLFYSVLRFNQFWVSVAICALSLQLFSEISYVYKAGMILAAIVLMLMSDQDQEHPRLLGVFLGLQLAPLWLGTINGGPVNMSVVASPIIGLALLGLLIFENETSLKRVNSH